MSTDRFTEQYRQLVSDPEIRAALLADPKAALVTFWPALRMGSELGTHAPSFDPRTNGCVASPPSFCTLSHVSGRSERRGKSPVHHDDPPIAQLTPSVVRKNR